jgi:AcrR family transcriptional regulator
VTRTSKARAASQATSSEQSTSQRIVDAAFMAFMEHGYAGASTLEIATRAGVSKRDLYANFGSKQAILVACIASRAARMRLPSNLPTPRSREMLATALVTFGATVLREVSQPAVTAMFRLAIAEADRSPEVAQTLSEARSVNRGALMDFFAVAQKAGVLDRCDPRDMAEQFFALLWGDLMMGRLLGVTGVPKPAQIDRQTRAATDAFLKLHADSKAHGG